MPNPIAYLNGEYVPYEKTALPVWDRGLVQGATITDMVRTFNQSPFRLHDHLKRFQQGCSVLGVTLSESLPEIVSALMEKNRLLLDQFGEIGILFFATPGDLNQYSAEAFRSNVLPELSPTICVHPFRLPFERYAQGYEHGVALAIPSIRQIPKTSLPPQIKYRSRLHWYLANQEAKSIDPEATALLLNEQGHVTETNTGNLFIVRSGRLLTPPADTTLPGITRQVLFEIASQHNMRIEESDTCPGDVSTADEAFLTSTTYGLMPVTRLNGNPIGSGQPGPTFETYLNLYSDVVGIDIRKQAAELSQHAS